ncbi:DUF1275 family protein, partial [Lactobacillus sp. UMNPBX4]
FNIQNLIFKSVQFEIAIFEKFFVLKTIWIAVILLALINMIYLNALKNNKKVDMLK